MIERDVILEIKRICEIRHWTLYRLAKESGLPYSSLNNLFSRGTCPSIQTLSRICDGAGITLGDFFGAIESRDGGDRGETGVHVDHSFQVDAEEADVLYMYCALSKRNKELLEAYLMGLCKRRA